MTCAMLQQNQCVFSFNLEVGGRMGNMNGGTKIIYTNANTNKNTGAKVTIKGRAPETPSDGSGDGKSYRLCLCQL